MPWIKLKLIERPYYDPRTGKVLESIEGRRNRPGIDPFVGGGKVYPEIPASLRVLSRHEAGNTLLVLVDGNQPDIDAFVAMSGTSSFKASPKETRTYDRREFSPRRLTKEEALTTLKQEIGMPAETTLDAEGRPVIPAEK